MLNLRKKTWFCWGCCISILVGLYVKIDDLNKFPTEQLVGCWLFVVINVVTKDFALPISRSCHVQLCLRMQSPHPCNLQNSSVWFYLLLFPRFHEFGSESGTRQAELLQGQGDMVHQLATKQKEDKRRTIEPLQVHTRSFNVNMVNFSRLSTFVRSAPQCFGCKVHPPLVVWKVRATASESRETSVRDWHHGWCNVSILFKLGMRMDDIKVLTNWRCFIAF